MGSQKYGTLVGGIMESMAVRASMKVEPDCLRMNTKSHADTLSQNFHLIKADMKEK